MASDEASDGAGGAAERGVGLVLLLFASVFCLVLFLGQALQAASPLGGLVLTEFLLVLLPAWWFVRRQGVPLLAAIRMRKVPLWCCALSAALGVTLWGVTYGIYGLQMLAGGNSMEVPPLGNPSAGTWFKLLLVFAVVPALCEEVLFRGVIQGTLERRGQAGSAVFSAVLFGIFHFAPTQILPTFVLGLVAGWLVMRTGSILPAMILHGAHNAARLVVGEFLARRPDWLPGTVVGLALGAACCGWVCWRVLRFGDSNLSPLACRPAGLKRPRLGWISSVAIGIVALGLLVILGASSVFELRKIDTAQFEPQIASGQWVVVALDKSFRRPLKQGDMVSIQREAKGVISFGRVIRVDQQRVWVETDLGEVEVNRSEIRGKVVHPQPAR